MSFPFPSWAVPGLAIALSAWRVSAATPVLKDVPYDTDHPSQALDVYRVNTPKPAPVMVYIHGGGWRAGSKNRIPGFLAKAHDEGWLAVVSVEYRFTDVATHPAQVEDCLRAIQFVRQHAREWNVDASRIGVTGGSAGGHLSAYVAVRDDFAQPDAKDPVSRQSSRVAFAIPFAGPMDWGLLSSIPHKHPAYRQLLGYEPGTPAEEMSEKLKKDVSPLTWVSRDDPPMLIVHGDADDIVPIEHGRVFHEALLRAGVASELLVVPGRGHEVAGAGVPGTPERATLYMKSHFKHHTVDR